MLGRQDMAIAALTAAPDANASLTFKHFACLAEATFLWTVVLLNLVQLSTRTERVGMFLVNQVSSLQSVKLSAVVQSQVGGSWTKLGQTRPFLDAFFGEFTCRAARSML